MSHKILCLMPSHSNTVLMKQFTVPEPEPTPKPKAPLKPPLSPRPKHQSSLPSKSSTGKNSGQYTTRGRVSFQNVWRRVHVLVRKPPPPCPNTGHVLVQGAIVRKHGITVFGQARVTARHAKHDNTKQQASIHPGTLEHMELQLNQHFAPC